MTDPREAALAAMRAAEALGLGTWHIYLSPAPGRGSAARGHLIGALGQDVAEPWLPDHFSPRLTPLNCSDTEVSDERLRIEDNLPTDHELRSIQSAQRLFVPDGPILLSTSAGVYAMAGDRVVQLVRLDSPLHELNDIAEGLVGLKVWHKRELELSTRYAADEARQWLLDESQP
ncbi:hypothetical protein GCM10009836_69020 [Pseudonocardia ailaonensis]|uniref:Uncharacterized protein n=1 Tax=Pseudonocardia ailaonensis TaxID=367279 RepID=A0ABN2NPH7_9PSEU